MRKLRIVIGIILLAVIILAPMKGSGFTPPDLPPVGTPVPALPDTVRPLVAGIDYNLPVNSVVTTGDKPWIPIPYDGENGTYFNNYIRVLNLGNNQSSTLTIVLPKLAWTHYKLAFRAAILGSYNEVLTINGTDSQGISIFNATMHGPGWPVPSRTAPYNWTKFGVYDVYSPGDAITLTFTYTTSSTVTSYNAGANGAGLDYLSFEKIVTIPQLRIERDVDGPPLNPGPFGEILNSVKVSYPKDGTTDPAQSNTFKLEVLQAGAWVSSASIGKPITSGSADITDSRYVVYYPLSFAGNGLPLFRLRKY